MGKKVINFVDTFLYFCQIPGHPLIRQFFKFKILINNWDTTFLISINIVKGGGEGGEDQRGLGLDNHKEAQLCTDERKNGP